MPEAVERGDKNDTKGEATRMTQRMTDLDQMKRGNRNKRTRSRGVK
jgi:hypothetical protein